MSVHLDKELQKKYGMKNVSVRKGDKVKIIRGQYRKKTGNVTMVSLKRKKVFVEGIENIKKDGTKVNVALEPTNLMIVSLNLDDKRRRNKIEKKTKTEKK